MRASPKKNIKIKDTELNKQDIGHIRAVMRNPDKYNGSFFYLVDFPKVGVLELETSLIDIF
jgi:hypothetical protein